MMEGSYWSNTMCDSICNQSGHTIPILLSIKGQTKLLIIVYYQYQMKHVLAVVFRYLYSIIGLSDWGFAESNI
jgi:hypothetical protein